jgi:alkanesulfonate monooxygenase SsuD/methylene tetrahydromethanopterin reductase-like flavin-dependent oxidoreductase (luciferase family)
MLLNAFHMNCVSHIQQDLWVRDDTRQLDYTQFAPWVELAQILEKGCFDALFLADMMGLYDTYRGSAATSIIEAMQVPVNDPALLIPAMAYVTEHLGFAFTRDSAPCTCH